MTDNNRLTKDHIDGFFTGLKEVAEYLDADPLQMMQVMQAEAGVRASAHNPNGNASGLIQFMPNTLVGLRWRQGHEAFRKLTSVEQLPYVRRYFEPHKGKLTSIAAIYVATFLPALIDHSDDKNYVLSAKNGRLGWAYAPNASFDANKDLQITVGELEQAVERNCTGPRWEQLKARLTGEGASETVEDGGIDLRTTLGIQMALAALNIDPGPVDGYPGPKTRAAVMKFQEYKGLTVDGIVGPVTRAALEEDLAE